MREVDRLFFRAVPASPSPISADNRSHARLCRLLEGNRDGFEPKGDCQFFSMLQALAGRNSDESVLSIEPEPRTGDTVCPFGFAFNPTMISVSALVFHDLTGPFIEAVAGDDAIVGGIGYSWWLLGFERRNPRNVSHQSQE